MRVEVVAGEQRDGRAERGDLREREVDEDDPALDHVHAEVGVDAGQDEAGQKRAERETEAVSIHFERLYQIRDVVVERA